MSKPVLLSGTFKRGSSWVIGLTRSDSSGSPIDMTGLVTRAMFRANGVDGTVKFTLTDAVGIVISDPTTGIMSLQISRTQSALFAAEDRVYFDVEQTSGVDLTYEWQSLTYYFIVDEQVTRDD